MQPFDSHSVLPSNMHKHVTHYIKSVANAVSPLGLSKKLMYRYLGEGLGVLPKEDIFQ